MPQSTYTPAVRSSALALAAEVGVTEAARSLGIARATLTRWRYRERPAGVAQPDKTDTNGSIQTGKPDIGGSGSCPPTRLARVADRAGVSDRTLRRWRAGQRPFALLRAGPNPRPGLAQKAC